MTAVAVWQPSDFETTSRGANLATQAVNDLAAHVAAGRMDDEIADAQQWAAQMHAIAKVRKDAAALNIQAARLECVIARRAGLIGRLDVYDRPAYAGAAKAMAKVTEDEFATFLDWISRDGSISTLWAEFRGIVNRRSRVDAIARGRIPDYERDWDAPDGDTIARERATLDLIAQRRAQYETWVDAEHARDAAAELLESLTRYGEPFTTDEAAEKLATVLGVDHADAVVKTGLQVMVREAIGVSNRANERVSLPDGTQVKVPEVITIYEPAANDHWGWVRVPWMSAGIDQLGLMVAYRKQQVADMAAAARALESLHTLLASASQGPTDINCAEILERVLAGDYDHQIPADIDADIKAPAPIRRRSA